MLPPPDHIASDDEWRAFADQPPAQMDPMFGAAVGVGPIKALRNAISRRDDFEGRSSRAEFWWLYAWGNAWVLIAGVVGFATWLVAPGLVFPVGLVLWIVTIVLTLASIQPISAVTVRRLHDTGRAWRWWWWLVPGWSLVYLVKRGDPHDNIYGPSHYAN